MELRQPLYLGSLSVDSVYMTGGPATQSTIAQVQSTSISTVSQHGSESYDDGDDDDDAKVRCKARNVRFVCSLSAVEPTDFPHGSATVAQSPQTGS
jgi:hypothetical protein